MNADLVGGGASENKYGREEILPDVPTDPGCIISHVDLGPRILPSLAWLLKSVFISRAAFRPEGTMAWLLIWLRVSPSPLWASTSLSL